MPSHQCSENMREYDPSAQASLRATSREALRLATTPIHGPGWRHRIFSTNEKLQLANDTYSYKMKDRGKDVGVIKGPKLKSCEFPGAYGECFLLWPGRLLQLMLFV
jgi:hypothetical protein